MDYSLGRLKPSETKSIEGHLKRCEDCRLVLEEERVLCRQLGELPMVSPANDVWALIRSSIRPRSSVFNLLRTRVAKLVAVTAVTAIVAVTLVNVRFGEQGTVVDKETVQAVTAIMMQTDRNTTDDPLGSNRDAFVGVIDEGI